MIWGFWLPANNDDKRCSRTYSRFSRDNWPFFPDYFGLPGFPLLFRRLVCPASRQALPPLPVGAGEVIAIMIPEPKGREVVSLLERNVTVTMTITIGTRNLQKYVSRTSVVFVSISFIVLMIISLAWLVFYYIQRFRYANARDRNQVRTQKPWPQHVGLHLFMVINRCSLSVLSPTASAGWRSEEGHQQAAGSHHQERWPGDRGRLRQLCRLYWGLQGQRCGPHPAVQVTQRTDSQVNQNQVYHFWYLLILFFLCRHLFHKSCVDPWLLDHRTCPMCKMNILKALGIAVSLHLGEGLEFETQKEETVSVTVVIHNLCFLDSAAERGLSGRPAPGLWPGARWCGRRWRGGRSRGSGLGGCGIRGIQWWNTEWGRLLCGAGSWCTAGWAPTGLPGPRHAKGQSGDSHHWYTHRW